MAGADHVDLKTSPPTAVSLSPITSGFDGDRGFGPVELMVTANVVALLMGAGCTGVSLVGPVTRLVNEFGAQGINRLDADERHGSS
jgi:hypothetical protein